MVDLFSPVMKEILVNLLHGSLRIVSSDKYFGTSKKEKENEEEVRPKKQITTTACKSRQD